MKLMITRAIPGITLGALCAFSLGAAGQAGAQQPAPPPAQQQPQQPAPPPPPGAQAVDVSDADIRTFAEIYLSVEEARNELTLEMNEAGSQEEAQEIQARMQEEIVAAISEHGWSVEQYNEVATAISNDPELRSQALDLINELASS